MATTQRTSSSARGRSTVRVVVVDDHPIFRKGLVEAIQNEPGISVCGEAGTVGTALAAIAEHKPDVAIVDLSLKDESGLDVVSALAKTHPAVRVLVLSGYDERLHADRALKAGALGYIMKDKAATELLEAVRRVAAGKSYVSP
jgi:two-component system, NarL family, response regulator NreC